MLRGSRFKRSQVGRNPSNLHVIPIASVVNNKPVQLPPSLTMQHQRIFPSVMPIPILPANTSGFFENNGSYRGKYSKKQRKRQRKRERKWYNTNLIYQNNDIANASAVKESEKEEVITEIPPPAEEDFEEVEVASSEGEGKKIPVGFRKTKLHYLNYKNKSFFKPKFYNFSSQRTVINCLNVEDDDSVDVDVVSEAEYDEYETGDHCDSTEKFGKIIEIEEESSNEITDEAEEETIHASDETEEESAHVTDEVDEESVHIVTDEVEESAPIVTDKVHEESSHVVNDVADNISTSAVASEVNKKTTCDVIDQVDEKSICTNTNEVGDKCTNSMLNKAENEVLCDSNKTAASITRIYKSCIKDNNHDLIQKKSLLIQDKLDAWESHLIGLEYLLEIQDTNKISVLKYFCVLCDEDLNFQELPEVYVINHINGLNHIMKYLEKHFPNCGFEFGENSTYDFVVIQKFCEKINEKFGYYFMCITNNDYYMENNLKIKEIIQNASHPSEIDFEFEKSAFEKSVDSDLLENISNIIKDMINKVIPENEVTTELQKDAKGDKNISKVKMTHSSNKTKPAAPNIRPKHKGNNSISSFLRLSFAATSKLGTTSKESSKKNKVIQNKKNELKEQIVQDVKSPNGGQIGENVKTHGEQHVTKIIKSDNEQVVENVKSKNATENVKLKDELVAKTVKSKDEKPEDNAELKNEQFEGKELGDEALNSENSTTVDSSKIISNAVKNIVNKRMCKNKEKVLLKATIHSKRCPKRILDKGISRLKLAAKTTTKSRLVTEVSGKSNVKYKSITENVNTDAPKKVISKNIKPELKESKLAVTSIHKKKPLYKVISVQKEPVVESKSSVTSHTNSHQKSVHKKNIENSSKDEGSSTVANDSSHWIPMKASSPVLTSDISLFLKKIAGGPSENPVKKRRHSKSPVRKITSPLRLVSKNHSRRYSKSPHRKRDSKSPVRRRSRSPYRKSSKSPIRRSRSPVRRRSRSPLRRQSRSPLRRRSRSPRRRSRSPLRHRSRSPIRRHSRSPLRRHSRSPGRRRSRSPLRKRSRSPFRRHSRSPLRRHSRSPLRRLSRSPFRRHSRSPVKRRSRSPHRRYSRSPIKRRSRSPYRRHSRSPVKKFSDNSNLRNLRQVNSPNIEKSSSSHEYYSSDERYHRNTFDFPKHLDLRESEIARSRDASKMLHSTKMNKSDRYKSQALPSISSRDIDLDPVSDEDESIYFSDKHLRSEDTNVSPTSKGMLSKLWQKLSTTDNSSDPALSNMLQFMETHRAEIEEFIALKSTPKSEKTNVVKIDSNLQQQTLLLQQFLLANLAGSLQEVRPSVSNVQFTPPQPPFLPENISHRFRHPTVNMPPPTSMPPVPPQPAPVQPRFFPPNVNVPPPHLFQHSNQPNQDFSLKPKPAPEVMFKDLKATVNKLFGANESGMKQNIKPQVPGFVTEPDPEKWDLNHPNAPKFNMSLGPKNVFPSSGKNVNFSGIHENPVMREQISSRNNNAPEQFFSGSSNERSQIPNVPVPPPNAKVTFCDSPRGSSKGNLFPVMNPNFSAPPTRAGVNDVKVSLAQRLASVLVKIGMVDVPAPLLQEMLMKIGAFSSSPRQDISENEILSILKRLGYL